MNGLEPLVFTSWVPDLQSGAIASMRHDQAEDIGIEPWLLHPRQFSRLLVPMDATLQAENCGPDPQSFYRSRDLAGRSYPGRLALQKYHRTDSNRYLIDFKSIASASWATVACIRGKIRTFTVLILNQMPPANWATRTNKKASLKREASNVFNYFYIEFRQYLASHYFDKYWITIG